MFAIAFQFDSPVQAIAVWCGLALIAILVLLRRPPTLTLAANQKGRLSISRHAINRLVEACCEQVNGVAAARAMVRKRHGKFRKNIRLKIRPNAKVDAIQGYLVQEITAIYRENLGLKDVGPIEIIVTGVVAERSGF